jgi:DNA-binding PadR family transcriptional regulator
LNESSPNPTLTQLFKGNAPLFVLGVLLDGPSHGYAIAQEISRRAKDAVTFKQGTLYPLLHDLEKQGLIRSYWQDGMDTGRKRRTYEITESGIADLKVRLRLWQSFSEAVTNITRADFDWGDHELQRNEPRASH